MSSLKVIVKWILVIATTLTIGVLLLSVKKNPEQIEYGISFSKLHADELELNWKEVYLAFLDDLRIRKFRLSAHWPMIEPSNNNFSFAELDFQIEEARKRDAQVILSVGRRLPGWPECHEPDWAKKLSWEEEKIEILSYIETVVNRYKSFPNIEYWQVENEPFLSVFAQDHCGTELDVSFLEEEIALVKELDPSREILVTDSGNLGLWAGAWRRGDVFGTSVYLYLWNPTVGQIRTVYLPSFYKAKDNLMSLLFGDRKSILIELSLEPWLLEPVVKAPIDVQLERMDADKFDEIIKFARGTGFDTQYLWGGEWWYWMNTKGHPELWDKARVLLSR